MQKAYVTNTMFFEWGSKLRNFQWLRKNLPRNPKPWKGMKTNHPTYKKTPQKTANGL
jgi:hypothetical protein